MTIERNDNPYNEENISICKCCGKEFKVKYLDDEAEYCGRYEEV